jgi:hypothetical protein
MAKKNSKTNKIQKTVKEAARTYSKILENSAKTENERKEYITLVERIVRSLEMKNKIDILAYEDLVKRYPQTKNTVNQLISELRTFSIYDDEPHTVNFDYSAYLKQIEELAKIQ